MPPLRRADPARAVHEPVVVHLPPLPAAPQGSPEVTPRRLSGASAGPPRMSRAAAVPSVCPRKLTGFRGEPVMGRRPMTVRVARWSAEHPWRAIALWVVFVAVCFVGGSAAGLNEATDADQAIGEAGRADAIEIDGDFDDPAGRERADHRRGPARWTRRRRRRRPRPTRRQRMKALPDVARVGEPVPAHDGSALLVPVTMAGDPDTARDRVEPLRDGDRRGAGRPTRTLRVEAGRRPVDQQGARRHARRGLQAGRAPEPAGHAGDPDRRVRRADRGRRAAAAGHVVGGRRDGPVHAGLAPGAGDRHHQQRDPADRHGGRRRLLAVLRPPGARGTGQGARRTSTRWRSPRRPPATRSWSPASRSIDRHGRPVPRRRRGLLLAGRRLDPRGRRRGARLADRAAGAAGQARPLGGPAAGAAAVAADRGRAARRRRAAAFWPARAAPGPAPPAGDPAGLGRRCCWRWPRRRWA